MKLVIIFYQSLSLEDKENWDSYIQQHPDIQRQVREFQGNKYPDPTQIPVSEEAFCDYFVNIASNKQTVSRLGLNDEAEAMIEGFLPDQEIRTGLENP